jgi:hypothetical protein
MAELWLIFLFLCAWWLSKLIARSGVKPMSFSGLLEAPRISREENLDDEEHEYSDRELLNFLRERVLDGAFELRKRKPPADIEQGPEPTSEAGGGLGNTPVLGGSEDRIPSQSENSPQAVQNEPGAERAEEQLPATPTALGRLGGVE